MTTDQTAEATPLTVDAVVGLWRMTRSPEGPGACVLALNRLPADGGFGVHIETCSLPDASSAKGWRPVPGGFELLRGGTETPLRFMQSSDDRFQSADGRYVLIRSPVS